VLNGIGGFAAAAVAARICSHAPSMSELAKGAAINALSGYIGNSLFPMRSAATVSQARVGAPRTLAALISGRPNSIGLWGSTITGGIAGLGRSALDPGDFCNVWKVKRA
jgi:hypothetical protein